MSSMMLQVQRRTLIIPSDHENEREKIVDNKTEIPSFDNALDAIKLRQI